MTAQESGTARLLDEQDRRLKQQADAELDAADLRIVRIVRAVVAEETAPLRDALAKMKDAQLTEEDSKALREMLEQDRRTRWLWSTARAWAVWIAAVVAGYTIGLDALKAMLKRLVA